MSESNTSKPSQDLETLFEFAPPESLRKSLNSLLMNYLMNPEFKASLSPNQQLAVDGAVEVGRAGFRDKQKQKKKTTNAIFFEADVRLQKEKVLTFTITSKDLKTKSKIKEIQDRVDTYAKKLIDSGKADRLDFNIERDVDFETDDAASGREGLDPIITEEVIDD